MSSALPSDGSSVGDAGSSVVDAGSSVGSSVLGTGSSAIGSSDTEVVGSSADLFENLGSSGISDILSSIQSALQLRDVLDGVGGFLDPILGLF